MGRAVPGAASPGPGPSAPAGPSRLVNEPKLDIGHGSIEAFLLADADDVARQTRGLVTPRLARDLRERCLAAGLRTDWTRLYQAHFETSRPPHHDPLLTRLRALLRASSETAPGRRWLTRVPRGWNGPPGGVDTT
jgi:hypothetical protein